ncbi:proline dehydrogenase [Coemansia sp. RSA 1813]|nr:proline dehydrogenase [Coemansia sp. RSA 1813]
MAALLARNAGAPTAHSPRSVSAAAPPKAAAVSLVARRGVSGSFQPRVPAVSRDTTPDAVSPASAARAVALSPDVSIDAAAVSGMLAASPVSEGTTTTTTTINSSALLPPPATDSTPLLQPDPTLALGKQGMLKLISLWFVYRACGNTALVRVAPAILKVFERLHLSWLSNAVIRRTFFAWFCAGEKEREIVHTMRQLKESGIGSILDYSSEADISEDGDAASASARAQANVKADALAKEYFHGMHMASQVPRAFAAIKITGLADPEVLYRLSMPYRPLRAAFEAADHDKDGRVDFTQFKDVVLPAMPGGSRVASPSGIFSMVDANNNDGLVDWVDIQMALGMDNPLARPLYLRTTSTGGIDEYGAIESDIEDYERMISRARAVVQQAANQGVRAMIDAEHTYFQPMIDHVALVMQREFNTPASDGAAPGAPSTLVFNTYQMYRADAYQRMTDDFERSQREGWRFASKLVRGAYMEMERERAARLGYPSPINATLEATHDCYNRGVRFLVDRIAGVQQGGEAAALSPVLFVATHNNESVERALQLVRDLRVDTTNEPIMFGQLLGMQDATSYALAKENLPIYKYVPYGSLEEVLPYLIRRAQENSAVAESILKESSFVLREITRRAIGTGRKDSSVSSTSSL